MRQKFLAANWKMNLSLKQVKAYFETFSAAFDKEALKHLNMIFALPYTFFSDFKETNFALSAQNLHWEEKGAYTGEISALMLKEWNVTHTLIGHSERRQYFAETDETVSKKMATCAHHLLTPIFCVGETKEERQAQKTFEVVKRQLAQGLSRVAKPFPMLIAYEPVWAIGTGISATVEQAQEVHAMIRSFIGELWGVDFAQRLPILYGGSATKDNISQLMAQKDIDGALVGSASLKPEDFAEMAKKVFL